MTKQDFLSGKSFRVTGPTYKGARTYKYDGECILQESRSSIDEQVIISDYHLNIKKIGRLNFSGFTFVMEKKVNVKYKFEDLIEFKEEA